MEGIAAFSIGNHLNSGSSNAQDVRCGDLELRVDGALPYAM
jgi:hypothetical protein